MKICCNECGQIYTVNLETGLTNTYYKLVKSSEVLGDDATLFNNDKVYQKRVCGNCYCSNFNIYF